MIQKILLIMILLCSYPSQARFIAVLAYGSLINELSRGGNTLKIKEGFKATDITFPISMRRHSGKGSENERITAVIDKSQGLPKAVYYATMSFDNLKAARENLSWREGSQGNLGQIFYIKKGLPNLETESAIPDTEDWYVRKIQTKGPYDLDLRLSNEEVKKIAEWASSKGYDAVIWASYPPNMASEKEVAEKLVSAGIESNLYKNTVAYINQLPKKAQAKFEKAVVSGPEALKKEYKIGRSKL